MATRKQIIIVTERRLSTAEATRGQILGCKEYAFSSRTAMMRWLRERTGPTGMECTLEGESPSKPPQKTENVFCAVMFKGQCLEVVCATYAVQTLTVNPTLY